MNKKNFTGHVSAEDKYKHRDEQLTNSYESLGKGLGDVSEDKEPCHQA